MNSNRLQSAALDYVGHGWACFPCVPGGKRPLTRNGLHDASTSETQIIEWWTRWPDANLGVSCGASGLAVIDVDNPDGSKTLLEVVRAGYDVPMTLSQVTGSGGAHYLYAMPSPPVRNTAGRLPGIPFDTPGLDLRGNGGYVVAAPSRTSGNYEWLKNWTQTVEPAPPWLTQPELEPMALCGDAQADIGDPVAYGLSALRDEVRKVGAAVEGTRNQVLVTAAFNLGTLVAAGLLDETETGYALYGAATITGLPHKEIQATITNGLEAGKQNPRRVG